MNERKVSLDKIKEAVQDIRDGKVVIVVDDEDRENEGDFVCAAEVVTPEIVNFMATFGRGLICAPIEEEKADKLRLELMVNNNTALHETAFTVSIDLAGEGVTTGISASDRAKTIKKLACPDCLAEDFARPGHIFPLISKKGGVLRRTGHTEAAIDLAVMAGLAPAGVLVEILKDDGSMARLPDLIKIAKKHELKIISIEDLVAYRMSHERIVREAYRAAVDSPYGQYDVAAFEQLNSDDVHLALIKGEVDPKVPTFVRVHSSVAGAEVYRSLMNISSPITRALEALKDKETGIVLVMRHHERNSEMIDRLKHLDGHEISTRSTSENQRDFGVGAQILRQLGVERMILLTNSPKKRVALEGYGLEIVDYVNY